MGWGAFQTVLFTTLGAAGLGVLYLIADAQAYIRMQERGDEFSDADTHTAALRNALLEDGRTATDNGGWGAANGQRSSETEHSHFSPDIARRETPL